MTTLDTEMDGLTRSVLLAIKSDRKSLAEWLTHIDNMQSKEELRDCRAVFDVPSDYGNELARCYILADLMLMHYSENMPMLEKPFGSLLASAFNSIDFMRLTNELLLLWRNEQ